MFGIVCIFSLVILNIFGQAAALVTLPKVEENDILKAEKVIRNTTNVLFSSLRLTNIKYKTWAKEKSLIHNYFVSQALQDYNTLKEIAKLTRVDKSDIENVTADFIALLNEILDEENILKLQNILITEDTETGYNIENEVEKLKYLNKINLEEDSKINKQILEILQKTEDLNLLKKENNTVGADNSGDNILDDNTFWHESDNVLGARRIFDGKRTKIKHFPFMASIEIFNKFQCAGCIIQSDLIITAASCLQLAWNNRFYRENPPFLSVRIGSSFYDIGGEQIGVQEIYFHPSYKPKNLENNLAVIRLERKINLKRKRVKKIHIDKDDHKLSNKAGRVEILGWGATTRSNKLHGSWENKLQHALLHIYPHDECRDLYSKEYVTKTNFCAGYISKGTGACNRDIGGPGIISGTLVGIISFGSPSCGTPDAPTVFTKLGFYYDWIEEIMEQDVPTYKKRTTLKSDTWSYPKEYDKLVPLSDSSVLNIHTIKSPKPQIYPTINHTTLGAVRFKTTQANKNIISNIKLRNIDNSYKDYFETMFENKREEKQLLSIELPKEQYKENYLSQVINNVKPMTSIDFQPFIQQPIAIQPKPIQKPEQYALSSPSWYFQRRPKLRKKKTRTTKNIKTNYPEVFIKSPFIIDNTPTKVRIDLEKGNKSYTLIRNDYHQKVLLPDEVSNIEIEIVANNTQQNSAIESSKQKEIPIESLRNQLNQFINTAEEEQKARQMQVKSHIQQIMGNTLTKENQISPEEIKNILMDSKLSDIEKHDLIFQAVSYQKSQNLNNRIKDVLADSKLSNTEKHDNILQLVTGQDLKNNNKVDNAVGLDFRLPQAIEELTLNHLHVGKNNEAQKKEFEQVPYLENSIMNVAKHLTNYEKHKYNTILPATYLNQGLYNINSNVIKGRGRSKDNIKLKEQEKYIMNVLTDPTIQKNEQYDLIMQATNANQNVNNVNSNFNKGRERYEGKIQLEEPKNYIANLLDDTIKKNYEYDLISHLIGTSQQGYNINRKPFQKQVNDKRDKSKKNILREKLEKDNLNSLEKLIEKNKQQESDKYDFFLKTIAKHEEIQNQIDQSINEIFENEINTDKEQAKKNNEKQDLLESNLRNQKKIAKEEEQHGLEPKTDNYEQQQNILRYVTKNELENLGLTESSLLEYFNTVNNQHNIVIEKGIKSTIFQNKIEGLSESEGDEKYFLQSSTKENVHIEEITTENINLYNIIGRSKSGNDSDKHKSFLAPKTQNREYIDNKLGTILASVENLKDSLTKTRNEKMHHQSGINNHLNKYDDFHSLIEQVLDNQELQDEQKEKFIFQILSFIKIYNVTKNNQLNEDSPIEKLQTEIQQLDQAAAQENESRTKDVNDKITKIFSNLKNVHFQSMELENKSSYVEKTIQNILNDNKMDDESKYKAIMLSVSTIVDNLEPLRNKNIFENDQRDDLENNIQNILINSKMDDETKYKTIMNLIDDQSNINELDTLRNRDDLENNIQNILINSKMDDETKYKTIMNLIDDQSNIYELDTLRNEINQSQNNMLPFENIQKQIQLLNNAETRDKEERAKLAYKQFNEIMNNPQLKGNKQTNYPEILENDINERHLESLEKENIQNDQILRLRSENTASPINSHTESTFNLDNTQGNEYNSKDMLQEFETYLRKHDENLQPVEIQTEVTPVIQAQNDNYKQFDSAINSNLDSMLDFVKSFKPKMIINSTQNAKPHLEITSNKLTQIGSQNETAYFENILQSLSELEKYTEGGHGMKIMNIIEKKKENNVDISNPSLALDRMKPQNMETEELITLLSNVLTPQEAINMPVQFNNETIADDEKSFSSEIVNIGSNFEDMKSNLQDIFSLLPRYEIAEQDLSENNTYQVSGEKEEELMRQTQNQDIEVPYLRSHIDELENIWPAYINLLQNKNVSKNKVAEILSKLLSEGNASEKNNVLLLSAGNNNEELDNLKVKYNKLLQNENSATNKVAFHNLLRNKNIAKNKVEKILPTLLLEKPYNNQQYDNFKLLENKKEESDNVTMSYIKLLKDENNSKNKVASILATLLSEQNGDDKRNDSIASAISYKEKNTMYSNKELSDQSKVKNSREEKKKNDYNYQTSASIIPFQIGYIPQSSALSSTLLVKQDLNLKLDDLILHTVPNKDARIDTTGISHTNNGINYLRDSSLEQNAGTSKKDKYYLSGSEMQKIIDRENQVAIMKLENSLKSKIKDISTETMNKTNIIYEHDYISDSLEAILTDRKMKNATSQLATVNSQEKRYIDQLDKKFSEEENHISMTENIKQNINILSTLSPILTKKRDGILKLLSNSIFSVLGGVAKQIPTVLESQKTKSLTVYNNGDHRILPSNDNTDSQQKDMKLVKTNNLLRNEHPPSKSNASYPTHNNMFKDMSNNFFEYLGAAGKLKSKALEHLGSVLGPKSMVIQESNKNKDLRALHSEEKQASMITGSTIATIEENVNSEKLISFSQMGSNLLENNIVSTSASTKGDIVKNIRDGFFNILGKVKNTALKQFSTDSQSQKPKDSYETKNYTSLQTSADIKVSTLESNINFEHEFLSITPSTSSSKQQDGELRKLADEFLMVLGNQDALKEEKKNAIMQFASAVESQGKNNVTKLRNFETEYSTLQTNYYKKPSKNGDHGNDKFQSNVATLVSFQPHLLGNFDQINHFNQETGQLPSVLKAAQDNKLSIAKYVDSTYSDKNNNEVNKETESTFIGQPLMLQNRNPYPKQVPTNPYFENKIYARVNEMGEEGYLKFQNVTDTVINNQRGEKITKPSLKLPKTLPDISPNEHNLKDSKNETILGIQEKVI